jgi:hypothetical protein
MEQLIGWLLVFILDLMGFKVKLRQEGGIWGSAAAVDTTTDYAPLLFHQFRYPATFLWWQHPL